MGLAGGAALPVTCPAVLWFACAAALEVACVAAAGVAATAASRLAVQSVVNRSRVMMGLVFTPSFLMGELRAKCGKSNAAG